MKKMIIGIIFGLCVLGAVMIDNAPHKMDGTIKRVSGEVVTVELANGHEYEFYGDGFVKGENVKVTLDLHHNESKPQNWTVEEVKEA